MPEINYFQKRVRNLFEVNEINFSDENIRFYRSE